MTRPLALSVVLLAAACQGKGGASTGQGEAVNAGVEFTAKTTDGKDFDLTAYRGKVVLVNVWATWCPPCRDELPELQGLHEAHGDEFVVIGISTDKARNHKNVRGLMSQFGITYPVVLDPDGQAESTFGVKGYPTSVLLDRNGVERWRREGAIRPSDSEADAAIKAALTAG